MYIDEVPLPRDIINALKKLGYEKLYPPQEEAIKKGLFEGKNLIVATPTASGKTFIAILLMIHKLLREKDGKIVYLVPLKALANEKYQEFKEVFSKIPIGKVNIMISTGDYDSSGEELRKAHIIIATYEKMDSLMRHNPTWIRSVRTLVVDEVHLIGSVDRGFVIENIIMRYKSEGTPIQILMLSATITNIDHFSKWIDGEEVKVNWRPVPLVEAVLYNHEEYFPNGNIKRINDITGDPVIDKTIQTLEEKGQVLIFTQSRNEAKRRAKRIANILKKYMDKLFTQEEKRLLMEYSQTILNIGEQTKLSEELSKVVKYGVAFHHAGLGLQHRSLIENLFREKLLKVITATPTLAAGVNLPSRTVIITYTSRRFAGYEEMINVFDYKQMAGRAGRPRYDEYGEALLYTRNQWNIDYLISNYILGDIEPITSKLLEGENLDTVLLSFISSAHGVDDEKIHFYLSKSLAKIQYSEEKLLKRSRLVLNRLKSYGMIDIIESRTRNYYTPTPLGKRVSELYILPSTGAYLYRVISRSDDLSEFELLYHISKTKDMIKVGVRKKDVSRIIELLEIEENLHKFLEIVYSPFSNALFDEDEMAVIKTTFVMEDWINEKSEEYIRENWGVEPGDLYAIYTTGEWLTYSASEIAKIAKNKKLANKYLILSYRLRYGVKEELVPLTLIPEVGRKRARALYNHGFKTILDLKKAELHDLISIPGIGPKLAKKIIEEASKLL